MRKTALLILALGFVTTASAETPDELYARIIQLETDAIIANARAAQARPTYTPPGPGLEATLEHTRRMLEDRGPSPDEIQYQQDLDAVRAEARRAQFEMQALRNEIQSQQQRDAIMRNFP